MVGLVGLVGSTTKKLHRPLLSERADNVVHGDTTCLFFLCLPFFMQARPSIAVSPGVAHTARYRIKVLR